MFHTLKYAKKLESVGIPREQAEAHVQMIAEITEKNLATKEDFKELKHDLEKLEYRLTLKLGTIVTIALATMATVTKFF